ncbi:MAG: hypothetical protein R2873_25465 [Caldilineaceae bacterium]
MDHIDHLNAPIIIDQKRVGGGSRSTVGTYTDIAVLLRLLFSRIGQPYVGPAYAFSFNTPQGMCPECEGIGKTTQLDLDKFLDRSKSLNDGAILHPDFKVGGWIWKTYTFSELFDNNKPIQDFSDAELEALLHGAEVKVSFGEFGMQYQGLVERFTRSYIKKDTAAMSDRNRGIFERFTTSQTCPVCSGARLNQDVLACRIRVATSPELADLEATELLSFLEDFADPVASGWRTGCVKRCSIWWTSAWATSASAVRQTPSPAVNRGVKMIRHLGNSLTEMLYILDEPTVGLHARDRTHEQSAAAARQATPYSWWKMIPTSSPSPIMVDMGLRAGVHGGEVVFEGSYADLKQADTLTGRFLSQHLPVKDQVRKPTGQLTVKNLNLHNLKNVTVNIPTGVFTVITGVAGSGKSTLINDVFLAQHPGALVIDQSRVTANSRSAPTTYTGIMDDIRKAFAKANDVSASLFSFNSQGSCPNCNGLGVVYTDLAFMEGIASTCEICEGKRFKPEVLEYHLRGQTISDVLDMTAEEALALHRRRSKPCCRL